MTGREQWEIHVPATSDSGPWPLLVEVAQALPAGSWSVVGGMMVQLHALRAGVPHERATTDLDALLHIETGATTFAQTAHALELIGFAAHESLSQHGPQHRFVRGSDVVDLLVADHAAPTVLRSRAAPHSVRAPGGTRALRNTVDATVSLAGKAVTVSLPDDFGALVLKARAYVALGRDRDRHLDDLRTLLAAQSDPPAVIERCNAASPETRSAVSTALQALRQQSGHTALVQLALDEYALGLIGETDRRLERS